MAWRALHLRVRYINLQVLWQISPPVPQLPALLVRAPIRLRASQFSRWIMQVNQNLIKDLRERTHLDKTRDGVRLFGTIRSIRKAMRRPGLDLGRVIHCIHRQNYSNLANEWGKTLLSTLGGLISEFCKIGDRPKYKLISLSQK